MATKSNLFHYLPAAAIGAVLMLGAALASIAHGEATADMSALLQEKRCHACHAMALNLIGPPYQAIAARHAARAEVMTEVLAQKIIHGGGGNWGFVPMVPNDHVSIDEARAMARWILELSNSGT